MLNHLNLEKVATQPDDHVRRQVFASIQGVAANLKTPPSAPELTPTEKEQLLFEVLGEVFRLGPLEPLLQDPTISDILVNGGQEISDSARSQKVSAFTPVCARKFGPP